MQFNTKLLHGKAVGQYQDGATLPPVVQSNAYRYESFEKLERVFSHKSMGYAYSRIGNPTVTAFERRINELEGGIGAVATSSGMAAISQTLLTILTPGDEIIAGNGLYGERSISWKIWTDWGSAHVLSAAWNPHRSARSSLRGRV